jgi:hypothetical protein
MFSTYTNIHVPPMQRALCVVLLICVFGLDDKVLTPFLARVMLVCGILVWMRCEWRVGQGRVESNTEGSAKMVKENYELSQTVLNLSDQHRLLCEIRTSVLKTTKYSRDTLSEIRCSVCSRCSSSSSRHGSVASPPENMPDEDLTVSPLILSTDPISRAKMDFRVGGKSESCIQSTNPISRAKMDFRVGGKSESCVSMSGLCEQVHK